MFGVYVDILTICWFTEILLSKKYNCLRHRKASCVVSTHVNIVFHMGAGKDDINDIREQKASGNTPLLRIFTFLLAFSLGTCWQLLSTFVVRKVQRMHLCTVNAASLAIA